jgi:hypothetical protein
VESANLNVPQGNATICDLIEPKAFVPQPPGDAKVGRFKNDTGLDLDRVSDLYKLLGLTLMTQSRNVWDAGAKIFAASYFAPLYTCTDTAYKGRLGKFIAVEYAQNVRDRKANRQGLGAVPAKLAKDYGLPYDLSKDY